MISYMREVIHGFHLILEQHPDHVRHWLQVKHAAELVRNSWKKEKQENP